MLFKIKKFFLTIRTETYLLLSTLFYLLSVFVFSILGFINGYATLKLLLVLVSFFSLYSLNINALPWSEGTVLTKNQFIGLYMLLFFAISGCFFLEVLELREMISSLKADLDLKTQDLDESYKKLQRIQGNKSKNLDNKITELGKDVEFQEGRIKGFLLFIISGCSCILIGYICFKK